MKPRKLSESFSRWLLVVIVAAFALTSLFTYFIQTRFEMEDNFELLKLNIADVKADIEDASNEHLLNLARAAAADVDAGSLTDENLLTRISAKPENDFSEINVVSVTGFVIASTNPRNIGFDMERGKQSAEFLCLLNDRAEYVQKYQPMALDSHTYMKYAGVASRRGGFVQVGYNAARFRQDIDKQVIGATRNRHVGERGFIIICADDGRIVSDPRGNEGKHIEATGIRLSRSVLKEDKANLADAPRQSGQPVALEENKRYEMTVYGEQCYVMYALTEGYCIIAAEPVDEVLFSRDLSVYITLGMEIFVFAIIFALVYFLIKKLVVENIHKINSTLGEITNGNLDVTVDVRTNEEFVSLSDDINSTVDTLKGYIAEAAARIDKELEVAKIIQSSTLPRVFPPYPDRRDFDIFATMDTAKEVGGDFYDFYFLDDSRFAFLVADVSGKGITAAMFMMKAKTLLKAYADKEKEAAAILTKTNEALCEGNEAEMFVTCWLGILDLTDYKLTFANAGHNPPLVRRAGGAFEFFKARPSFVLGEIDDVKYRAGEIALAPGDEIYLYTDGVTEAMNENNELFGNERLLNVLNEPLTDNNPLLRGSKSQSDFGGCSGSKSSKDDFGGCSGGAVERTAERQSDAGINRTAEETCRAVKAAVDEFVGGAPQFDDITMLHLKLLPKNIISVTPDEESMATVAAFVEDSLVAAAVPMKIIVKLNIAVDEIYSNIINYSGAKTASVECAMTEAADGAKKITVVFIDDGKPYDPTQREDPDITADAEERDAGGMGILIVKKFMDEVKYSYRDERNILTIVKSFYIYGEK